MAVESPQAVDDKLYHFREQSITPPVFFGYEARRLGIEGIRADSEIGKKIYLNLFDGYSSDAEGNRDKDLLGYRRGKRNGAYEIITNDPKDPTLLAMVAGDERINNLILRARAAVAKYVEESIEVRVTKKSEIEKDGEEFKPKIGFRPWRKTNSLVMVWWDHPGTRDGDPGRHGHLTILNISHDAKQGTTKSIDFHDYKKAKATEIYRDTMIDGLKQLGYKCEKEGNEYRIAGVQPELRALYSRRSSSINERIAEHERKTGKSLSPASKRKFGYYDRPEKSADMPLADRQRSWIARMTTTQFDGLRAVVSRAKGAVLRSQWHQKARGHIDKLYQQAIRIPEQIHERSQGRSR